MAENSKIEWTAYHDADGTMRPGYTMNFWIGCQEMGPPCDHCYARVMNERWGWVDGWGPHGERKRTSPANWKKPLQWAKQARKDGTRPKVFALSLGDWLDNQAPQEWREAMGDVIRQTPELDWLLLTKRIGNYNKLAPWSTIPPNVWLGITCGDQKEYERDWPVLAQYKAAVRFISNEPMLGPLNPILAPGDEIPDWIICGGESGRGHRQMPLDWARDLRDECASLGVPFFFKQASGKGEIPPDLMVRQFPTPRGLVVAA